MEKSKSFSGMGFRMSFLCSGVGGKRRREDEDCMRKCHRSVQGRLRPLPTVLMDAVVCFS